jgi:uncharacterized protein (TIGR01777 family)
MRILVTGATGLIGSHLTTALAAGGHRVSRLVRSEPGATDQYRWSPDTGQLDPASLRDCEAVVHLAGESIAGGRWTRRRRAAIRHSRVESTRLLCAAIARAAPPPSVLVCASGIGYYGDRGDELLTEDSGPGGGFLADLAQEWEAATRPASDAGVRVVVLRQGMVLDGDGGGLPRLALPFRLWVGGRLGNGRQWLSWIALDDLIRVIQHALARSELRGPVNAVAPQPSTNGEFCATLARVLGRPSWLPAPALALRCILGEMGRELLLFSQRAVPARLVAGGFVFAYPDAEAALRHVLRRDRAAG